MATGKPKNYRSGIRLRGRIVWRYVGNQMRDRCLILLRAVRDCGENSQSSAALSAIMRYVNGGCGYDTYRSAADAFSISRLK